MRHPLRAGCRVVRWGCQVAWQRGRRRGHRVATSVGFVVESIVGNGKHSKIDERATEKRCDGDFVQQRCLLPTANAQTFVLAQSAFGIVRPVRVVALADARLAQQLDGALQADVGIGLQDLKESPPHTVIAAGEDDKAGLVGRVLPAVAEDEQTFFAVVTFAGRVGFGQCLD
jgi:hypothetical protein